jgi:hypothetical protein
VERLHAFERNTLRERLVQENRKVYEAIHVEADVALSIDAVVIGDQE